MNHKSFERLSESELNEIEGEAGPLLEELGYLRARR
jgi:bacteriocin-like protein